MIWLTAVLVVVIYVGIAIGRVPFTRMNRATIALVGASVLVLVGAINQQQALASLDMGTILLLGAMMVMNNHLRLAGFFRIVTQAVIQYAGTPRRLLALIIVASGVLSALFLNDTICLMMTPIVVDLTLRLKRNPIPYLLGLGVSANVGSVATITGNPQNIIIGQSSGISYTTFFVYLAPVALVGLAICWGVLVMTYRAEFQGRLATLELLPVRPYRPLLNRTLGVVFAVLVGFSVGLPIVTVACVGAGVLLVSRLRPHKLLALDWDLLMLFAGMFVVTGAIEHSGLSTLLFEQVRGFLQQGILQFTVATSILSNMVSNVPAVLLFRAEMGNFSQPQTAWLTLAMASTLAGNLTLVGSAATLIVAELARARGVKIEFVEFLKVGAPITVLTLTVGVLWLSVVG